MASKLVSVVNSSWKNLKRTATLGLAGLIFLTSTATSLSNSEIHLTGHLLDKKNNPLPEISTTLVSGGSVTDSTETDEEGRFDVKKILVGIDDNDQIPTEFKLNQNYPNPFNPSTNIEFSTLSNGTFAIYNLLGQEVVKQKITDAGHYTAKWGGLDKSGRKVASGMYFYQVRTVNNVETKKMIALDVSGISGLNINQGNSITKNQLIFLEKTMSVTDTLKFEGYQFTPLSIPINFNSDIDTTIIGNTGPIVEKEIIDTILAVGDTLNLNLETYVYNDEKGLFVSRNGTVNIQDSLLQYIATQPETLKPIIDIIDRTDENLQDTLSFNIYVPWINSVPIIDLPDTITFNEDDTTSIIIPNLNNYRLDTDRDQLNYSILNQSDTSLVKTAVNDTTLLRTYLKEDGFGTSTIGIIGSDGELADTSFTVLEYLAVNDAPEQILTIPNQTIDEDTQLKLLTNSFVRDVDLDSLRLAIDSLGTNATYAVSGDTITVTPNENYNGAISGITINVNDGTASINLNQFDLTINPVNDAPVFTGTIPNQIIPENSELKLAVGSYFSDIDGDTLAFTLSNLTNATYTVSNDTITITPNQEYNGLLENLLVNANDGQATTSSNPIDIVVSEVNNPPEQTTIIANQTISEDNELKLVMTNFVADPESNPLSYVIDSLGTNAAYTVNGDTLTITPNPDYNGLINNIVVNVSDGNANINLNPFDLIVNSENDIPVQTTTIPNQVTAEDSLLTLLMSDYVNDVDGDSLSYLINSLSNATYAVSGDTITVTPNENYNGAISGITINVNDGTASINLNQFDLTINPVNDAPVFSGTIPDYTIMQDSVATINANSLFTDIDSQINYVLSGDTTNVNSTEVEGNISLNGKNGWTGTTSLLYIIGSDGSLADTSNGFTLTINEIIPENQAPTINIPNQTINEDENPGTLLNLKQYTSDESLETVTYRLLSQSDTTLTKLGITDSSLNVIYLEPNGNGNSNISIEAIDAEGLKDTTNFTLTVNPVNDAPVATLEQTLTSVGEDTTGLPIAIANIEITDPDQEDTHTKTLTQDNPEASLSISGNQVTLSSLVENWFGTVNYSIIVNDGSLTDTVTGTLTVNPINDAPTFNITIPDYNLAKDSVLTIQTDTLSTDVDGDEITTTLRGDLTNITPSQGTNSIIIIPDDGWTGTASLYMDANDGALNDTSNTFTITYYETNTPPTINLPDTLTIIEDDPAGTLITTLKQYSTDENLNNAIFGVESQSNSTLININMNGDSLLVQYLQPDSSGNSQIIISIDDGQYTTLDSTIVKVDPQPDAPTLTLPGSITVDEDASNVTITDLLANTIDPDNGESFTYQITKQLTNGQVSMPGNVLTLDSLATNWSGTDTLKVEVTDKDGLTDEKQTIINVNPINDAPTYDGGDLVNLTVDEDNQTSQDATTMFSDVDNLLIYSIIGDTTNVKVNNDNGNFTFTPIPDWNGTSNVFQYKANDGEFEASSDTFRVIVNPVNDAPTFSGNISNQTTVEDSLLTIDFSTMFADVDNSLTYVLKGDTTNLNPSINSELLTITPTTNWNGTKNNLYIEANDGQATAQSNNFNVTVDPVPDKPELTLPDVTTAEDTTNATLISDMNQNLIDPDTGENYSYSILKQLTNGQASIAGSTLNLDTLATNWYGIDTLTIEVNDGTLKDTSSVEVIVASRPDAPTLTLPNSITVNEDASNISITDLLANTTDPDSNEIFTYTITKQPTNGTANTTGNILTLESLTQDWNGTDTLKVRVTDKDDLIDEKQTIINVNPINDAPTFSGNISDQTTNEDSLAKIILSQYFSDIDNDPMNFLLEGLTNADSSFSGDTLTITPDTDWNGTITDLIVKAIAGEDTVASNNFSLNVIAVNDLPVEQATIGDKTINEDNSLKLTMKPTYVTDIDGDTLSYLLNIPDSLYTVIGDTITITPNENYNGLINNIVVNVNDGTANINLTSFDLTVNAVNDKPSINISNQTIAEDTTLSALISNLDTYSNDIEGTALTYSILSQTNTSLVNLAISGTQLDIQYLQADGIGSSTIDLEASDGALKDTTQFNITVQSRPDKPVFEDMSITVNEDTSGAVIESDLDTKVTDPDSGETFTYSIIQQPDRGAVSINPATNTLTLDSLTENWYGNSSFEVEVTDKDGLKDIANVAITVNPVNDAPTISIPDQTIAEDTSLVSLISDLRTKATDVEGDSLIFSVTYQSNPTLVNLITSTNQLIIDSLQTDSSGTSIVRVKVEEYLSGLADSTEFLLTVDPRADITLRVRNLLEDGEPIMNTDSSTFVIGADTLKALGTLTKQVLPGTYEIWVENDSTGVFNASNELILDPYLAIRTSDMVLMEENNLEQRDKSDYSSLITFGTNDMILELYKIANLNVAEYDTMRQILNTKLPDGIEKPNTLTPIVYIDTLFANYDQPDSIAFEHAKNVADTLISEITSGFGFVPQWIGYSNSASVESSNPEGRTTIRLLYDTGASVSHTELLDGNIITEGQVNLRPSSNLDYHMEEIIQSMGLRSDPGDALSPYILYTDGEGNRKYNDFAKELMKILVYFDPGTDF